MSTTESALDQLHEHIRGLDVAMLTTVDRTGRLHSRPMMTLRKPFEGALWFFAQGSSHMVDDVHGHHPVNLSYADSARGLYVSVSGRARMVRDAAKQKKLWEKRLQEWLPLGVEDPSTVLLRVEVQEAEYWLAGGEREFVIAAGIGSTGEQPRHGRISFA